MDESAEILAAIRDSAKALGRPLSRSEFKAHSGISEHRVLRHFNSWREAVRSAGLIPNTSNERLSPDQLLSDWCEVVRKLRRIPTRLQYDKNGNYHSMSFEKHIGPWALVPVRFRSFAVDDKRWLDVLPLLPLKAPPIPSSKSAGVSVSPEDSRSSTLPVSGFRLDDRPVYGNPIDFRGLRHEPVNEDGVIFLFGMVARELGFLVESVQAGFPDCEAKRQVRPGKWQRVRIEFEFESRNFRDHGHPLSGCDLIVCWRHNWSEVPPNLEVIELRTVLQTLATGDE